MNIIKPLSAFAFALAILVTPVFAVSHGKCCEKAKAEGKDCAHPCCVEAKKANKACEKCGGKNDAKPEEKK
ncbi:MAG: hypothetical protein U0984_13145 [Prosthecobacter sp.]|nr:hypothetical protein [Prosthecobacter sp.]